MTAYRILDAVADSFNPLLAIVALAIPFLRRPRTLRATIAYYLSTGAAIGFVYLVRAIDDHYQIWATFGLDYSTHSAFASSLAASMSAFRRRCMAPAVIAVVLYFVLELVMRYHGVLDIVTSSALAAIAALLLHWAGASAAGSGVEPSSLSS
jgi:hypothetical protein